MITTAIVTGVPYVISLVAVVATFYGIRYTNRVNIQLQQDRIRSDERLRNQEILRSKGEHLYAAIDEFEKSFRHNITAVSITLTKDGKQKAIGVMDLRTCSTALQTIEMLSKVYFPSTAIALEELDANWEKRGTISIKIMDSSDQLTAEKTAKELILLSTFIADSATKLQKEVIRSLQKLLADVVKPG